MRKLFTLLVAVLLTATVWAQAPQKMSYQAVIRNSSGHLVTSQVIGMEINIRQGSTSGTIVYTETQTPTTNANGLVSIEIGDEIGFSTIDWATNTYFIETKTAVVAPLTTYTITGVSQLLSVPYALNAKTAETITGTINETDPIYTGSQAVNITANDITNLSNLSGTNTGDQDLTGLATITSLTSGLATKVEIEAGKGLSTNDYTTAEQTKLAAITGTNTGDQDLSGLATTTSVTAALNLKAPLASPTFTGTVAGITSTMVGLGNVNNTSDASKPISTATQTALNLKAPLASPTFTGTITVPTPVNATDASTKQYVDDLKQRVDLLEAQLLESGVVKIKDVDGNMYSVVKIGSQLWMAENLKTTQLNDGTPIVNPGTDNSLWSTSGYSTGFYSWYNNDIANKNIYGGLYNHAITKNSKLCPTGWHVSTTADWDALISLAGGTLVAGGKLKETGTGHWTTPNTGATDEFNFTILGSGRRAHIGPSEHMGIVGHFWTPTGSFTLSNSNSEITYSTGVVDTYGFSVRCVKD